MPLSKYNTITHLIFGLQMKGAAASMVRQKHLDYNCVAVLIERFNLHTSSISTRESSVKNEKAL
jgi:hypothetical protein